MEESQKSLLDYFNIIRRRKIYVIVLFPVLLSIVSAVVYMLPPIYQSKGIILIESQEIPNDLVRSTVTSYAEQQIELIRQRVMATSKITDVINKYNVYGDEREAHISMNLIDKFRENVLVEMISARVIDPIRGQRQSVNIAFEVSFMDESPEIAQRVANELVTFFLAENIKARTGKAAETLSFLTSEADKMRSSVQELEEKMASFKVEFGDSLPELLQFNLSMIEGLEEKNRIGQENETRLADQIHYMNVELSNMDPSLASSDNSSAVSVPLRLAQLNSDLAALRNKYSESHPDVKRIKREVSTLERGLANKGGVTEQKLSNIYNPVYRQLKMKIDASEKELSRLRRDRAKVQAEINEYQERVSRTHQVQRAYDDLTRDHENKKNKYQELRAKQLEASIAQNLESESKAESFTLIEPPVEALEPVKPDRPKLLLLGFVLAGATSLGVALLVEMLDPAVRGAEKISGIIGAEPLAVIPIMLTVEEIEERNALRKKVILAFLLFLGVGVALVHFFIVGLDLIWYKLLAQINML